MTLDDIYGLFDQHYDAAPKGPNVPPMGDLLWTIARWMFTDRGADAANDLRHLVMESEVLIGILEGVSGSLHDRLSDIGEDL